MKLLTRAGYLSKRAIDEKARTVTYVAATEGGVDTWSGKEYLRMAGCKLDRYAKNPVFLDSHRYDTASVIGRSVMTLEPRQLLAEVTYAKTQRAEDVWTLVRDGFLSAVSVGFNPITYRELRDGEVDGEGQDMVTGPGIVIPEWELYELSQVPVPADEDALIRRSFMEDHVKVKRSIFALGALAAPKPAAARAPEPTPAPATAPPAAPAAPATAPAPPVTGARAADAGAATGAPAPAAAPAADDEVETDLATALRGILKLDAKATDEQIFEAIRATRAPEPKPEERSVKAAILELAPPSLRELAEGLVLREGMTVEVARKLLLEEHARRSAPVGTPAPSQPTKSETNAPASVRVADLSENDIAGAFKR